MTRPVSAKKVQFLGYFRGKAWLQFIGTRLRLVKHCGPSPKAHGIGPVACKGGTRAMKVCEGIANRRAAPDAWVSSPHAFEKCHQCRRTSRNLAEGAAMPVFDWLRTIQSVCSQMLHEPEEERQAPFLAALF